MTAHWNIQMECEAIPTDSQPQIVKLCPWGNLSAAYFNVAYAGFINHMWPEADVGSAATAGRRKWRCGQIALLELH
jgi:hypothetical protein